MVAAGLAFVGIHTAEVEEMSIQGDMATSYLDQ